MLKWGNWKSFSKWTHKKVWAGLREIKRYGNALQSQPRWGAVTMGGRKGQGEEAVTGTWRRSLCPGDRTDWSDLGLRWRQSAQGDPAGRRSGSVYPKATPSCSPPFQLLPGVPPPSAARSSRPRVPFREAWTSLPSVAQSEAWSGRAWPWRGGGSVPGTGKRHLGLKHFLLVIL